ncbi:MAG: transcription antitermination factor NusB [Pseudomonadota bacterium]
MTDNQPAVKIGSDKDAKKRSKTGSKKARNSAARLLAVQAVYQILSKKNEQSPEEVIQEFVEHRAGGIDIDGDELVTPDIPLFKDVVFGVFTNFDQLHDMVKANRGGKSQEGQKTEPLLFSLFLCGSFELMVHQSIDAPVIISDYLHATRAFYDENEVKLVNALLDSTAKTTR